ncbi:hypothetical protein LB518_11260 [Mesorhizobium sp. BR1-1-16]|uniref:hypothetical protein n=1 Tax=Mesorhizobium sp. BR1-1-16 TaxID=2876653 RepID=UPI001CCB5791|nr:hypothetical protein [Mesorhizobium sp. BR1-1-16]MBZ9936876.1 hypothetical protein [Mesorhizobium sp. BR1-1-16]
MQRALVQLAAFQIQRLTGRRIPVDYGPVEAARLALGESARATAALAAPVRAAHHFSHLDAARSSLDRAVDAALARGGPDDEAMFALLEQAEHHLKIVSRNLPGFEPVDFSQACCANHGLLRYSGASASP